MKFKPLINKRVVKFQFACNSEWEKCLIADKFTDIAAIDSFFEGFNSEFVGVEAFFYNKKADTSPAFIGFRIPASKENIVFCRAVANLFTESSEDFLLGNLIYADGSILAHESLFDGPPDFMELGIVNLWNSFGPMRFWNSGDGDKYKCFSSAITSEKRFLGILPGYAAIELAYTKPLTSWLGFPADLLKCGGHYLSFDSVNEILSGDIFD